MIEIITELLSGLKEQKKELLLQEPVKMVLLPINFLAHMEWE